MNNDDWWHKPRQVSIVVDNPSWVLPYCQELADKISARGDIARLCLAHDEIQLGDIAWTTSLSFVATANSLRQTGAQVDFIDIDPKTFNLDLLLLTF